MKKIFLALFLTNISVLNILHCELKQSLILKNQTEDLVTIGILSHPENESKNIHFQLITPKSDGPFDLVTFFHGAKIGPSFLAREHAVENFRSFLDSGYAVLVPSFPGFAFSDGPFDYCGDYTKDTLNAVINHVLNQEKISNKQAIIGFGMGAIAALLVGASRDDINCIIASNGLYDMPEAFRQSFELKWKFTNAGYFPMIDEEIYKRSMIFHLDTVNAPTLFIHSKNDPYVSLSQSISAHTKMLEKGKRSQLLLLDNDTHMIPLKKVLPKALEFIKQEFSKRS